jgi:hypothetical protein
MKCKNLPTRLYGVTTLNNYHTKTSKTQHDLSFILVKNPGSNEFKADITTQVYDTVT